MQKVVTINLNGNAYQLDESGYVALVAYLDGADRSLRDNPDRAEIVADLEQAIADKCRGFLGPHKAVVTATEVDQIIRDMGPVESSAGPEASAAGAAGGGTETNARPGAPRRLYLIHEGAMLAGVCTGIAAYLHVDVTIVRIVFLVLALVTRGGFGLAYLVLAFVIPSADTSEERAAAHGQPFNAQELIERAKKKYASFTGSQGWDRHWRREQRASARQRRAARWQSRGAAWGRPWGTPPPAGYPARVFAGVAMPILSLMSIALFWLGLFAIFTLVTRNEVFGRPLPNEVPLWLGVVLIVVVYQAVTWPIHLMRRSSYYAIGGAHYGAFAAFDTFLSLGFVVLVAWLAYHYSPEVREILRALPDVWNSFGFEDLRI